MHPAPTASAAILTVLLLLGTGPAAAQQAVEPPPMRSILAGKTFVPPAQGQVQIEFLQPEVKRDKNQVITRIQVKNVSRAPIARLTIDEIWYAPDGSVSNRGRGFINGLLQPGEVRVITIETPYNPRMNSNNWNFSHANGTVDPKRVQKMEPPTATAKP